MMKMQRDGLISFHYLVKPFYFFNITAVKQFLRRLFRDEGIQVDCINYIFCDDEYLLGVNKSYLKHDYYTDIITFELSSKGQPMLGDIFISVDRVRENAATFDVSFRAELLRVMIHGALHLSGHGDTKKKDQMNMRRLEDHYLEKFQFHVKRAAKN